MPSEEIPRWHLDTVDRLARLEQRQIDYEKTQEKMQNQLTWLNRFMFGTLVAVIIDIVLLGVHA